MRLISHVHEVSEKSSRSDQVCYEVDNEELWLDPAETSAILQCPDRS
jgi:hypothetical protein